MTKQPNSNQFGWVAPIFTHTLRGFWDCHPSFDPQHTNIAHMDGGDVMSTCVIHMFIYTYPTPMDARTHHVCLCKAPSVQNETRLRWFCLEVPSCQSLNLDNAWCFLGKATQNTALLTSKSGQSIKTCWGSQEAKTL